jgi:NAD(P)H-hydrate epimerase
MMSPESIPYLSASQMVEVDRLMIEVYGFQLIQMMENAGRHLAELAKTRFLKGDPYEKKVVILAGSGGNGGGAMVAARNLHNWGAQVFIALTKDPNLLQGAILQQASILQRLNLDLSIREYPLKTPRADLIIDGLIGYSLQGAPRGRAAELIKWANRQTAPILSLDLPSGLDATSGEVLKPAIQARATLTLALPKIGLAQALAPVVGELYLADIGVPPQLYAQSGLNLIVGPIFQEGSIIRLR